MAYGCAGVQSRLDSCLQRTNERTNSSRCPSELQPTEIGLPVWGTAANFDWFYFLASLLQRRRLPEANQTLHDLWPSPGLVQYIYIFGGLCFLTEFRQVQISLCIQVVHSPILPALLQGTPAASISQTLWCGTRNGITELAQTAPPIFGWAAITLGIGPHSSSNCASG